MLSRVAPLRALFMRNLALVGSSVFLLQVGCSPGSDLSEESGEMGDGDASGGGGTMKPDVGGDGDGDGDIEDDFMLPSGDGDGDGDGDGEYCNDFATTFQPKTPTVYILVDQSQSMFEETMFWERLKEAALPVVEELADDVLFGFGSYTGTDAACVGLTEGAPIAANNYAAIETAYEALGHVIEGQTPTQFAIRQARELLLDYDAPGDRFILLVSDGGPDFCDDPNQLCADDALIAELQLSAEAGVKTLVFGIENKGVTQEMFDYFAQAGMGQAPASVDGLDVGMDTGKIEAQCATGSYPEWEETRSALGNAPDPAVCDVNPPARLPECHLPAGKYSTEGGTASAFLNADPAALAEQILTSVEALKSCRFEFNFEVKDASKGEIFVGGGPTPIPRDQWEMVEINVLELKGDACATWQDPTVVDFFAGFPCESIEEIIR